MMITIQRLKKVKLQLGISRSTCYLHINQGLLPKPISIGSRAVGWPSHEIDAILNARISGCSDSEIKELVNQLQNQRSKDRV
jgi:prophage regulatory protein